MKNRRFVSVLLVILMVMSMFASIPFAAQAAGNTVSVSDWDGLQNAIKKASSGQVIQLGADITCKKNGGDQIKVDKKTVTIDLNGHTLDRNRDKQDADGHVIEVKGKSTLTIIDSVGGGKITGGYAKRGGGVNVSSNSTLIIESGTITGNQAKWGGGIYVHGTLTMNGGVVTKNTVTDEAGGIFCNDDSVVTLNKGVVVSENTAENGGGILNEGGTLTMTGVQILNNRTTKKGGGGINAEDKATTTLTNCTVSGNEAKGNGGGIYHQGDSLTVKNCTFSKNQSDDDGGAIFAKSDMTVDGGTFEDNYAFNSGGAIRVDDDTTTVKGGTFTKNEAGDSGGAIYVNDSTLKLYGGSITSNSAQLQGGGVLIGKDGGIKVHGAPVVKGNTAAGTGNDIYLRSGKQIEVDAALTSGAVLVVDAEKRDKAFTKNFNSKNKNENPAKYFGTEDGWVVLKSGSEGIIRQSNWTVLQALVAAAKSGDTIVLDRDYKGIEADGALNITKNQNLTIDLNGHTMNRGLTKAAAGGAVIMNDGVLTIKDSKGGGKITGGYANDHAGGIWNTGELILESGAITGNKCVNNGGGVYNKNKMTVTGGTISNNNAGGNGGGVFSEGMLIISGGKFTGNKAELSGGALNIAGKTTTITGGTFTGNQAAKYHGGGIYLANATLNLYGGSITGNKSAMEAGGILYGANATVNVKDAPVVDGNTAPIGANMLMRAGTVLEVAGQLTDGAKLDMLAQDATKVLTSGLTSSGSALSAFTYNQGQGAAPTLKNGELFVEMVTVTADVWVSDWDSLQKAFKNAKDGQVIGLSRNISCNGGTELSVVGKKNVILELNGRTIDRGRKTKDKDSGNVIGLYGKDLTSDKVKSTWVYPTLTIRDSVGTGTIKGGWCVYGGGIYVGDDCTLILEGGTITDNQAEYGGGIYSKGTVKIKGGSVSGNTASDTAGGIYVFYDTTLEMTGGTVSSNTAKDCGGIYIDGSKKVTLANVLIADNRATEEGGGGFNNNRNDSHYNTYNSKATMTNCVIRGNSAKGNGGGIWNQEDSTVTLENCTIEDNTADGQGGGVFTKGKLTVTGGAIKNNTAKGNGGGIRLWDDTTTINSGEITGNKSQEGHGGGIYVGGATLNLYGGAITGNTASGEGGGIRIEQTGDGAVNLHGSPVVKDNTATTGNGIFIRSKKNLTLDGALTAGAMLYVTPEDDKAFTKGFNTHNKGEDPAKYFSTDEGYSVRSLESGEAKVIFSDWSNLQRQIDAAADGATIVLEKDWFAASEDYPLTIPQGKTLTIDLNGHKLDRALTAAIKNGCVISNSGTLTIVDATGKGRITGGFSKYDGGGIWNDGTLTLEGVNVTGNRANTNGGGIYNTAKGALTVNGGMISSNTASNEGAGIYTEGTLTITGGAFKGNTANLSGGAVEIYGGTATITGGSFTGNTATKWHGGGIYLANGTLNLYGGSVTGNRAGMEGGGVLYGAKATVNVQDAPLVRDNTAPTGANILLRAGNVIRLTGPLADSAKLDVTAQDTENVLTKGLAGNGSLDNFTYNNNIGAKPGLKDGELAINLTVEADVWVTDWSGLQKAVKNAKDGQVIALGNNVSANGADRIKVDGSKAITIDLNGYTMDRGRSKQGDDGHVIEVTGKATLTIRDTRGTGVIKGGYAKRGGGINVAEGSTCIFEGGTISGNKAKWGGGVYAHGTFKMTGGVISSNEATASGGGIHCGSDGTLDMTGGTVIGNSAKDCGGIFNSGSKKLTLKNVRIIENVSTEKSGGGFNNNDGGSATLTNCEIRGNRAAESGGGLWNQKDSSLTLNNCTIEDNTASVNGGGVFTKGELTLSGGSFTGNNASTTGGGVYVTTDKNAAVNVSGVLVVSGNTAGKGANVYLTGEKVLTVSGAMADGANVGVTLGNDLGVFAKGFASKNPNEEPDRYFTSDDSYDMVLESGDAALAEIEYNLDDSDDFIPRGSRVASYENVNSKNWMSAISGERTLNEINIPGTHDSSMNKLVWHGFSSITTVSGKAKNARTQYTYIDEQLDAGYRWLDLRVNNRYEQSILKFTKEVDDGRNLWMCHGKAKTLGGMVDVGTIWAGNRDGDTLSLDEVLGWVKEFLRKHPTETIVLSLSPETPNGGDISTIKNRAWKIMRQLSKETNPSTGKSYVYAPNGFGNDFNMPKLKDVRGQIVLGSGDIFGGLNSTGYRRYEPVGENKDSPYTRVTNTNAFFAKRGNVALPKDAITHLDLIYRICTNATWEKGQTLGIPKQTPLENAEVVIPAVFGDGGYFDQQGYLRGWVTIDGATAREAAMIWKSNFYDMDYVTVTVKSGLSAADLASGQYTEAEGSADGLSEQDETDAATASGQIDEDAEQTEEEEGTQTYLLLKGTEITVPECIYEYDPAETGRDFQSWNATGETVNQTYRPGETFVVMEDTTFTGQWLAQGETSVDVKWQDMNDLEGLRADSLELQVWPDEDPEHVYTATVAAADGWRAVLEGDVQKIVPVWERVDANAEGGADTVDGYRYELADAADLMQLGEETEVALAGSGLILTMIHTPQETVAATGTVEWDDYDNRDGLRPESATLSLMKGEEELASQTVTAQDEWKFDFGELPRYENGQMIAYTLVEDAITGYSSVDTQLTVTDETEGAGFTVTNVHYPKVVNLVGIVEWNDNDNADGARPESTTVRLLANGEEIASLVVTKDGADTTLLDVPVEANVNGATEGEPTDETEEEEAYEEPEDEEEEPDEAEGADEVYSAEETESTEPAEGGEAAETVQNAWLWSFYGVPVYSGGSEVTYTIVQDEVPGYSTVVETDENTRITNATLPEMVTVTFDANGGEGEMDKVEIAPQSEYALPESGFTAPEGMEFAGWTVVVEAPKVEETESETEGEAEAEAEAEPVEEVNEEATEAESEEPAEPTIYSAGDAISVSGNATIIAQWLPIPPIYTVTFDGNGGEGAMEAAEANEEGEYTLPESGFTAPEGMEFAGWKVNVEEAQLADEPAVEVEAETAENAEEAEAAEASEEPAEFAEYTYEPGDTITLTGNATAIAQWQAPAKPIAITFDANGGEGEMEAAEPGEDGSYALPENGFIAPEGAEFIGWRIATEATQAEGIETETEAEAADESGRVFSAGDVIVVSADTTVIAQWQLPESEEAEEGEAVSVTVTLKVVNGTWGDGTRDDKIIVLTPREGDELRLDLFDMPGVGYTPDEGYDMGSWDVEPSINVDIEGVEPDAPITEDTTYTYTYAVKEDVEVPTWTILFDANGGEGEMENATVEDRDAYALPECGYTAPEGMEFAGWLVSDYLLDPGEILIVNEDIPVTAQWREIGAAPTEEQPTEDQPEEGTEEQPTEDQPEEGTEEQPTDEQPTEAGTEEQPEEGTEGQIQAGTEEGTEEQPEEGTDEQPVEAGTEEQPEEQPEEGTEEQPEEQPVEGGTEEQPEEGTEEQTTDEQPAEGLEVEYGDEPVEEPGEETTEDTGDEVAEGLTADTEGEPEEQPTEAGTEEQPEEQPTEEQPGEPTEEQSVEAPADAQMRTITFDGGGADGEMAAVQVAEGSEYTLPECEYSIEGCVFSAWSVSVNGAEPATYNAGETITVTGDMTAVAGWAFDEGEAAVEPGEGEIEYGEGESTEETAGGDESGLEVETEDAPEETPVDEGLEAEGPSEAGSVFSGAGIAAIVAAAALALGAGGVAVARKKKRK